MREIALLGILLTGVPGTPQRPPRFEMEIKTVKLADSLYLLEGAGRNVAAFVWDEGVLLVDDKLPPASPGVKAAVAAITPKPIRFVVNSHFHRDHSGGNEALAGDGSIIVAHENVRRRMSVEGFIGVFDLKAAASPPRALPVVTFTRDVTFHLGGEEISVVHADAAHTDGTPSFASAARTSCHMGDCYLNGSFPVVDYSSGGTFTGIIAAADTALASLDAGSRIIPGHGPCGQRPGSARVARHARDDSGSRDQGGGGGSEPRAGEGRAAHARVGGALPEIVRHVRARRGGGVSIGDVGRDRRAASGQASGDRPGGGSQADPLGQVQADVPRVQQTEAAGGLGGSGRGTKSIARPSSVIGGVSPKDWISAVSNAAASSSRGAPASRQAPARQAAPSAICASDQ